MPNDLVPQPDPTLLTTAALHREVHSLEKMMDYKLTALKELVEQRATSSERALEVAKNSLNEMRGMAVDQQVTFIPKGEYMVQHKSLEAQVLALGDRLAIVEGERKGTTISTTMIIGMVSAMLILAGLVVNHVFTDNSRFDNVLTRSTPPH